VQFDQGNLDASIDSHRQALAIAQTLAKADPANVRWQRDLMLDNSKVGQLLMAKGSKEDALTNYRDALSVAKTMGDKDQTTPDWQSNRAMIDSNIGALMMGLGNSDDALVAYRDGLTIAKALTVRDPHNVEWQTGLVIALYNLGEAGDDRTVNFTQALDILKKLDAAGTLPPGKKEWIAKIEGKLGKMKRPESADPVAPSQASSSGKIAPAQSQKIPPKHQPKHHSTGG
jgi:tetratricopeptide (TPR) repeat protein